MPIDPRQIKIESHTPAIWEEEQSFQELMAEQLRHAPWLVLSIVIHAVAVFILLSIQTEKVVQEDKKLTMEKPPEEEVIEEEEEPEEEPEEEQEEEPILQDVEVTEEEVSEDVVESFEDTVESAFDSDQWNTAVGLGGGAGGKFGGRGGGRKRLAKGGSDTARAIELGLEWLKNHQDEDGRWDADDFMKHDVTGEQCDGPGNGVHDIGVTGLALLAFLGDGSDMRKGAYRDVVKKSVKWLRSEQDTSGLFGTSASHDFIYDHAIAALAMVEAYGLSDYKLLRKYAQGGLNYLESHRNPYGVWRYYPQDGDKDTSVTGWAMLAYKSAQDFNRLVDAKLLVNEDALKTCAVWFDSVTDPSTGHHGYSKRGEASSRHPGDHEARFPISKSEAMTAVGLLCRIFLGQGQKPKDGAADKAGEEARDIKAERKLLERCADLIVSKPPSTAKDAIDHYYWYYGTYALYQMGGKHWKKWQKALTKSVVDTQREDGNFKGSWDPNGAWGEDGGRVYSTATLVLTLEAYYRYARVLVR